MNQVLPFLYFFWSNINEFLASFFGNFHRMLLLSLNTFYRLLLDMCRNVRYYLLVLRRKLVPDIKIYMARDNLRLSTTWAHNGVILK